MGEKTLFYLDTEMISGDRMTSFGTDISSLIKDFIQWVKENEFQTKDLVYAEIFERKKNESVYIASLKPRRDEGCDIIPANGSHCSELYKPRRSFIKRIFRGLK